jgi:hypothetical protein
LGGSFSVTILPCFLLLSVRAIDVDGDRPAVFEDEGAMGEDSKCCDEDRWRGLTCGKQCELVRVPDENLSGFLADDAGQLKLLI